MFVTPHGTEDIQKKAEKFGLVFGQTINYSNKYDQSEKFGFKGNTFEYKDSLKAAGARWDGENKAWVFDDIHAAESALRALED